VLLTIADTWCSREEGTVEGISDWFIRGNNKFEGWLTAAINEVHQLSKKKQEAVRQLVKSGNNYLAIFLDLYAEVHFYPVTTGNSIKNSVPSPGVEKHFS
jgi:hypothetical protein